MNDKSRIELLVLAARLAAKKQHGAPQGAISDNDGVDWIVASVACPRLDAALRHTWFDVLVVSISQADAEGAVSVGANNVRRGEHGVKPREHTAGDALDRVVMAVAVLLNGAPEAEPHCRVTTGALWQRGYLTTSAA